VLFLETNGCRFTATEEDAAEAVLSLAPGSLDETAIAAWMRAKVKRQQLLKSANLTGCSPEQPAVQATYSDYPFLPVFWLARA